MLRPLLASSLVALLALVACGVPDPVLDAPSIASFTADPEQIHPGCSSTLVWSVSGATSVTLFPGGIDVTGRTSWSVVPAVSTTYTLVATNVVGDASASKTIVVGDLPTIESFERLIEPGRDLLDPLVNPGVTVTLAWSVDDAESVSIRGPGLPEQGVDVVGSIDVTPPTLCAIYTLSVTNSVGLSEYGLVVSRSAPAFSLLIAGQSNAKGSNLPAIDALARIQAAPGVQMLGNDYLWKVAYEPTGDCRGHVDLVSIDPRDRTEACTGLEQNVAGVSPGVSFANHLATATGREVFIVPAAVFGSALNGTAANDNWQPPSGDSYDTDTLFGSAANRARLAESERGAPLGYSFDGGNYGAVLWYQGESDATTSRVDSFYLNTDRVLAGFEAVLGAPIIIVQLSSRGNGNTARNLLYQRVREVQRSMAEDARTLAGELSPESQSGRYLVVTHDLPMTDESHLSAEGQIELGRRVSLAVREHLFDEAVDGTGPRLDRVEKVHGSSPTVVRVVLDHPVTAPASSGAGAYSGYFAAFSGGDAIGISSIVWDVAEPNVVRLTLAATVDGEVQVRYMPPAVAPNDFRLDVVRSASCTDPIPGTNACLPLPAFGVATSTATASALRLMIIEDED